MLRKLAQEIIINYFYIMKEQEFINTIAKHNIEDIYEGEGCIGEDEADKPFVYFTVCGNHHNTETGYYFKEAYLYISYTSMIEFSDDGLKKLKAVISEKVEEYYVELNTTYYIKK